MTLSPNEHILIEAYLNEVMEAENELESFMKDEEGKLNVKLSVRSYDIITAAVGYIIENKEMDGDLDD